MARESKLQKRIQKRLRKDFGGKWYIISGGPFQEDGMHDIIGCLLGRFVSFEVKKPGEEDNWTPMQQYQHRKVIKNGGVSKMVTSYDMVKAHLLALGFEVKGSTGGKKKQRKPAHARRR